MGKEECPSGAASLPLCFQIPWSGVLRPLVCLAARLCPAGRDPESRAVLRGRFPTSQPHPGSLAEGCKGCGVAVPPPPLLPVAEGATGRGLGAC